LSSEKGLVLTLVVERKGHPIHHLDLLPLLRYHLLLSLLELLELLHHLH
jgi:hypothetical protein